MRGQIGRTQNILPLIQISRDLLFGKRMVAECDHIRFCGENIVRLLGCDAASGGIFAVDALWDGSSATYTFCTQAEGSEELHPGAVLSIGESEDIRKIDISWRSGSVNIYAAEQSAQIEKKGG